MQDIKSPCSNQNILKNKNTEIKFNYFPMPVKHTPILVENNKPAKEFIGKKLKGDAELISWLSGIEMNTKSPKDDEGFDENNSKIKKKLKNKLIKNAKKCEHYFKHKYPEEEYICAQCAFCLKRYFNHNELIRFINFDDFIHYLKYIFYLSDKVICYSINNFKSNKKSFDTLFSQFKKKEEKWNFSTEKIMCKLCMFKLINKPDFIPKIKSIFINGENEKSYDINDGDIVIELNIDENKNKKNENNKSNFVVEKCNNNSNKNNKMNNENKIKKEIINYNINNNNIYNESFYFPYNNNYNNPNCLNIYNSNNININIKNNNKIINNFYNNSNYYNSFLDFCEKIKNNTEINELNQGQINLYWKQLFCYNHNKIIDYCVELKTEINNLRNYYICYINNKNNQKDKDNSSHQFIVQESRIRTLYLLKEISNSIIININFLNVYLNDLNNVDKNSNGKILNELINENEKNYNYINQIILTYMNLIYIIV